MWSRTIGSGALRRGVPLSCHFHSSKPVGGRHWYLARRVNWPVMVSVLNKILEVTRPVNVVPSSSAKV
jgi:hypothetical protein